MKKKPPEINAATIKTILHNKYKLPEWSGLAEYRPFTGWNATVNSIDFFAVGLYKKNRKAIAFEIKVRRADFVLDVQRFQDKHEHALNLSHEFYYICPWGLIDPQEVPQQSGLMWINASNRIQIKKVAQFRIPEWIQNFQYLQGFLKRFQQKTNLSLVPVNYLGKEVSQEDIMEMVEKRLEQEFRHRIKSEALSLFEKEREKDKKYSKLFRDLRGLFYFHSSDDDKFVETVLAHCKLARFFLRRDYHDPIAAAASHLEKLKCLLDDIEEKEGKK